MQIKLSFSVNNDAIQSLSLSVLKVWYIQQVISLLQSLLGISF